MLRPTLQPGAILHIAFAILFFSAPVLVGCSIGLAMVPLIHRMQTELGSASPENRWRRARRGGLWAALLFSVGASWPMLALWFVYL